MCTATWTPTEHGYEFLFNRDELLSRGEAEPPTIREPRPGSGDPRWIAPADPDFGGTWISVNEAGLALGLLNGFRAADRDAIALPPDRVRSRGLLVADLAPSPDLDEVEVRLARQPLDRTRSFRLLALVPGGIVRLYEWDRRELVVDRDAASRLPFVSSSFEESKVGEARRAEYERITGRLAGRGGAPVEALLAFHRSTRGGPSAFTVAMRRPEAATRSFTRVTVGRDEVGLRYAPGLPRAGAPETALRLPRIALPSQRPAPPAAGPPEPPSSRSSPETP
jgi:hypothetical protein